MNYKTLALAVLSVFATTPSLADTVSDAGTSPTTPAGWEKTSDTGGFEGTVKLQGTIEKAQLPWMWMVGDGKALDKDGNAIFNIGSDEFKKGTNGSVNLGGSTYVFTTLKPSEPINFLMGYTKEAFGTAKAGITPKVEVTNNEGNKVELTYKNALQTIRVDATGKNNDAKAEIKGALDLKFGTALNVLAKIYYTSSGAFYFSQETGNGWSDAIIKSKTLLSEKFTDYNTLYTKKETYNNYDAVKLLNGTQAYSSTNNYLQAKNVTGSLYSGIYEATIYWGSDKAPQKWTAPIEITVTMI